MYINAFLTGNRSKIYFKYRLRKASKLSSKPMMFRSLNSRGQGELISGDWKTGKNRESRRFQKYATYTR